MGIKYMFISRGKCQFIIKIILTFICLFGWITLIIQINNSYSYYEVDVGNNIKNMSGKIIFSNTENCICVFSESTACLNVFDYNNEFLYSAKIPHDAKDNYHIYIADEIFSIGTGYDHNGNNTSLYRFNYNGYIDKVQYNGLIPKDYSQLEVNNYKYTSDIFGNVFIDDMSSGLRKQIKTSLSIIYMNDPIYPLTLIALSSLLLLIPFVFKMIYAK